VRKLVTQSRLVLDIPVDALGETVGEALLRPTRIYVQPVLSVLHAYKVKQVVTGMAHITGGGLKENIERVLPPKCNAIINRRSWTPPPVFPFLQKLGVARAEMFKVFNMGIGFVLIVKPAYVPRIMSILKRSREQPIIIGRIQRGGGRVVFK